MTSANLTKLQLAKKIKKNIKILKIKIIDNKKDPDQRDYFVSNKKIEKMGFFPKYKIEQGIKELALFFKVNKNKILNNY